jgi:hypothetical protein
MPENNQNPRQGPGNMRPKAINFASIFRRKEDPPASKEQSDRAILLERFAGRQITLSEGDLTPVGKESTPLDWALVNGHITIPASLVEGILEGRTRIRAELLKKLDPSPVPRDTQDSTEYTVSLAALIPQIEDLLEDEQPEMSQPEFETPFTVLAREDNARFEYKNSKQRKESGTLKSESPTNGNENHSRIITQKLEPETPQLTLTALHNLSHRPPTQKQILDGRGGGSEQPQKEPDPESQKEEADALTQTPATPQAEAQTAIPQLASQEEQTPARLTRATRPGQGTEQEDRAQQGMEQLQEIFMTSRPLDGRLVASFLEEFPGINGALILLAGGTVLGGQLPDSLDLDAALQAPEILTVFTRFISEVEGTRSSTIFVSVRAATTISLVASGDIFLVVSHTDKALPPGVAKRLVETAEALNLIYGQNHDRS